MANNVAQDVCAVLDADSSLGLTKGTDLFSSQMRPASAAVAADSVFVSGDSGAEPIRSMGQTEEVKISFILIVIRNTKFADGSLLARNIMDTLQGSSISGYLDVAALQSGPTVLGEDSEGLHLFSLNYQLSYIDAK